MGQTAGMSRGWHPPANVNNTSQSAATDGLAVTTRRKYFAYRPVGLLPFNWLSPFSSISISYHTWTWIFLWALPAELFDYGEDHSMIDMIAAEGGVTLHLAIT